MQLLSTPGASFSFDETLPPAPPPILSSLQDPELRIHFERFAAFLYNSANPPFSDPLSAAIFRSCVSHLVQPLLAGTGPIIVNDTYVNGSGNVVSGQRCLLRAPLQGTESLTALIVRRFEELRATSPQDAHEFHLYLYVAIHYFFVWYCIEIHCIETTVLDISATSHRFSKPILDYIQSYVKYCWAGLDPPATDAWFSEAWFQRICTIEWPALWALGQLRTRFSNRIAARKAMAETLRRANLRLLEIETRAIIGRLVGQPSGAGTILVDAYDNFVMYGLGDGTGTVALFGRENYGLAFFNYTFTLVGDPGGQTVEVSAVTTASFPMREAVQDSITFFYFGLEASPLGSPSINVTPYDAHGAQLSSPTRLVVNGSGAHRFKGTPGSTVTAGSLSLPSVDSVRVDMASAPLASDPEEVVFIVFKHRIGDRPSTSLEAEWTFNDNRFSASDAIEGPLLADQAMQDKLKLIVSQAVAAAGLDVQTSIQGYSIGESLNHADGEPGCDLRRAANQTDTHFSDSSNAALRYCHGRIYWSPTTEALRFTAEGFVSPLRCTWDSHLAPTGNLTLQGTFGQFLLPTGQPSYNCVLSAFRAFSICEAMMQAVMAKAADMKAHGDITALQANTLIGSLNAHLTQAAIGHIQTPNGRPLMRRNPEQEIVVTHSIFHGFTVQ